MEYLSPSIYFKFICMMAQILKVGITEYEPRVINQMLEFASRYVTTILDDVQTFIQAMLRKLPLMLPPDRYCLTAPNYRLKSLQKKASTSTGRITVPGLSVGPVTSRPSTPTLGSPTPQTMSISTKVGTPMSLTGQRFTVQMPTSQSPAVKASIPATSAVQNVLINPSLIGSKNILITTNMVSSQSTANESSNALKRKHEDDDDDDGGDYENL
uniref:Transcription initiation factor TFIID subunit 9 n=1 Tax=Aotus nancymaae TaxID=37293 RepID=A0A2K5CMH8_AOTNA